MTGGPAPGIANARKACALPAAGAQSSRVLAPPPPHGAGSQRAAAGPMPNLWALILAGGDGTRLAALTRALYRRDVPKQFAVLEGDRSLLQRTLDRIAPLVPARRTVVVVGPNHEALAREQITDLAVELVVQPRNLETAPGLLAGLAHILRRDPEARVAVFPADHHVQNPAPLLEAIDASRGARGRVTLLGVIPGDLETEYGWIVPGRRIRASTFAVSRFVEKPPAQLAARLADAGGLWNTFILVAPARALWSLAKRHLPEHTSLLADLAGGVANAEKGLLQAAYLRMAPASFSRAVLEQAGGLAVMPVEGTGWSDWGSPQRVFRALQGTPHYAPLLARITATAAA